MSEVKKSKAIQELRNNLLSVQDELVNSALDQIDKIGDSSLILPLIDAYFNRETDDLRKRMAEMLGTLKISQTEEAFLTALADDKYSSIRKDILAFMWHSGAQPSHQIALITRCSLEGDFEQAMEGLTLIESLEGPFEESDLLDAMMEIREYLAKGIKSDKDPLIKAIHETLVEYEKLI